MSTRRLRSVLTGSLTLVSVSFLLPGRLEATCSFSLPVAQLFEDWIQGCYDHNPVGGFVSLISNPGGANSNGTDVLCESSAEKDGRGQYCSPGAGSPDDSQVIFQYDFGNYANSASVGCPAADATQGGSPLIAQVVANDGSSAIVRTSYDFSMGGYNLDFACPYDDASGTLTNLFCRRPADQSVRVDRLSSGAPGFLDIDLTVLLPTLESDCNPGTLGAFVQQCPNGLQDNPVVTRGRLFTRWAGCRGLSELRSDSWTLSAVQPDADGHAHLSVPLTSLGCLYVGTTYAYDGNEIPAIAGFKQILTCLLVEGSCPDMRSQIRLDVADPSLVWWAAESRSDSYNLYRGDLAVLKQTGMYTQDPASVPLAERSCDLPTPDLSDFVTLAPGQAVFYLVSVNASGEGSLGTNSAGQVRPNTLPCH